MPRKLLSSIFSLTDGPAQARWQLILHPGNQRLASVVLVRDLELVTGTTRIPIQELGSVGHRVNPAAWGHSDGDHI